MEQVDWYDMIYFMDGKNVYKISFYANVSTVEDYNNIPSDNQNLLDSEKCLI